MDCKIKKKWIELEKEHTKSNKKASKIVKDHLREFGCQYYPKLIKMEKNLIKPKKKHCIKYKEIEND